MSKINVRPILIISSIFTLLFVIGILSTVHDSGIGKPFFWDTIGPIFTFPIYILYFLLVDKSHDPYGSSIGAGFIIEVFGPVMVFILWFIFLYVISLAFCSLTKRDIPLLKERDNSKNTTRTWITLGGCAIFVIVLDIFMLTKII